MCTVDVVQDDDIFDEWFAKGSCGWQGPMREDTTAGMRQAESDADAHESHCEKD